MAKTAVIVGGTSGLGLEIARTLLARGETVFITGRDRARAEKIAGELGKGAKGLGLDLTKPESIAAAVAPVPGVDHLVITAIERVVDNVREYDAAKARALVTMKVHGYSEVVHALCDRLTPDAAIVMFGGIAKNRPYPGSTTMSTVNGAVDGLVNTLAVQLAPVRVNSIHPGIVGDSPAWAGRPPQVLEGFRSRTPTGRLPTMADIVGATLFLLDNPSVNGVHLNVDGGTLLV